MNKYVLMLFCLGLMYEVRAMEEKVPIANQVGLQFTAKSEAEIVGLAKRLLEESTPTDKPKTRPSNYEELSWDQQLQWWVNLQSTPSDHTRLARIFRLIEEHGKPPMFISSTESVIPETSLRELDVLVGSGSDEQHRGHSLANRINHTQLHVGAALLARHLVQVKKKRELQSLQRTIHILNSVRDGKTLRETLQEHLKDIASNEDCFLSFWVNQEQKDALEEMLKESRYKGLPFALNEKANVSPFWTGLQQVTGFILPAISPIGSIGFGTGAMIATWGNLYTIGIAALSIPFSIKNIPNIYRILKVKAMALYLMQQKLTGLAIFVKKLNALHELLSQDHYFPKPLVNSLALPMITAEMQKLTDLLEQRTFESEPSFWSHWGKICAAYRLMLQTKKEFVGAYLGLGTIDFLTSLNALLVPSTSQAPFCFAHYTPTTEISAHDCWSPLLDSHTVVTNDVSLGGGNPSALVITGPNARGKTTLMRSIAGSALLASTLGIGSARTLSIPAGLNFLTSINVGDDPARNLSLFKAVVERIGKIIAGVIDHPSRIHLIISDEPFVGTDRDLAETCALALIQNIAQRRNVLSLFSSHFNVKKLGDKLPAQIANYHLAEGYHFVRGIDPHPEQYDQEALAIIAHAVKSDPRFVDNVRDKLAALRSKKK
jgi:MutS domain V